MIDPLQMKKQLQVQEELLRYFQAEKAESVIFVLAAAVALIASVYLWQSESSFRAMWMPLCAVGLIQLAVGGSILWRTNSQVSTLTEQIDSDPGDYRAAELQRMEKVQSSFKLYKGIEIAVLAAGLALTYFARGSDALYAVGVGCVLEGSLMLVFDLFAERRAQVYVDAIRHLLGSG